MTLFSNRYQLIKELGSGAFGHTFLVEDTHSPSRRQYVLKQLKPVANPEKYLMIQDRFQREAAILEQLGEGSNGQVPRLYAYFSEAGSFYLVQEWIEGQTLTQLVKDCGQMTEKQVQDMLIGILTALEYIHANRIIHRDIKPDNIMIRERDGKYVLIDFGMVKEVMTSDLSPDANQSVMAGTPSFMAIEQFYGKPVFASDIYSLGVTAIHALTGKNPQDLAKIPGDIRWRQYALNIDPAFGLVLDKSVAAMVDDRYKSARQMLDALYLLQRNTFKPDELFTKTYGRVTETILDTPLPVPIELEPVFDPKTEATLSKLTPATGIEKIDSVEMAFWDSIRSSTNPKEFAAYLKRYPKGQFAELAEIKLEQLTSDQGLTSGSTFGVVPTPVYRPIQGTPPPDASPAPISALHTPLPSQPPSVVQPGPGVSSASHPVVPPTQPLVPPTQPLVPPTQPLPQVPPIQPRYPTGPQTQLTLPPSRPPVSTMQVQTEIKFTNQLGMDLVMIGVGSFLMGSTEVENEGPVRQVSIRRPFYMGKYQVTQKQWLAVMGQNPSNFSGDNLPVEQVSWEAAVEFLRRLNASGGKFLYRLPTEAEWEYACRAGTTTRYSFGDDEKLLGEYAWYDDNSAVDDGFSEDIAESSTQPVGKKKPNAWGLHDMHGNVWEWCLDWYHDTYQGAPPDNRPWDDGTSHQYRVVRGGSWLDSARYCRSARRRNVAPQIGLSAVGFRVVAAIRM